jgi:hypothetical protein
MRRLCILMGIIGMWCVIPSARAALIPPHYFSAVVALGAERLQILTPGAAPQMAWATEGTGFFYGELTENDPDPKKRKYRLFLVTARHVVDMHVKAQREDPKLPPLSARLNPKDLGAAAQEFIIPSVETGDNHTWFFHPNTAIDVAVVPINGPMLLDKGISFEHFDSDVVVAPREKMKEIEVSEGDGVFVLGFPMGLSGKQRNYVILRQGAIARIAEMLGNASTTFMLDCFVFPGNSGGPVILKPDMVSIQNTKSNDKAYLIGMVLDTKDYTDVAYSKQTGQPRVLFEENSGLADIIPMDYIDETIKA